MQLQVKVLAYQLAAHIGFFYKNSYTIADQIDCYLQQLVYEFQEEVREQVSDLFEHNWIKVCSILTGEMGKPSFELELNVLTIIK